MRERELPRAKNSFAFFKQRPLAYRKIFIGFFFDHFNHIFDQLRAARIHIRSTGLFSPHKINIIIRRRRPLLTFQSARNGPLFFQEYGSSHDLAIGCRRELLLEIKHLEYFQGAVSN
jgi:hypothetical protein